MICHRDRGQRESYYHNKPQVYGVDDEFTAGFFCSESNELEDPLMRGDVELTVLLERSSIERRVHVCLPLLLAKLSRCLRCEAVLRHGEVMARVAVAVVILSAILKYSCTCTSVF